jgi:hypothetical protein
MGNNWQLNIQLCSCNQNIHAVYDHQFWGWAAVAARLTYTTAAKIPEVSRKLKELNRLLLGAEGSFSPESAADR